MRPPNPSQTGWYSINLPRRDGRLSWPRWLAAGYTPKWFICQQTVTHPASKLTHCRATSIVYRDDQRPNHCRLLAYALMPVKGLKLAVLQKSVTNICASTALASGKKLDMLYPSKLPQDVWNRNGCLGGAVVERWTRDRKVSGSTPGRGAIKSTRSTQPSMFHPSGSGVGKLNRVPACMAGVKAGCVHLCRG